MVEVTKVVDGGLDKELPLVVVVSKLLELVLVEAATPPEEEEELLGEEEVEEPAVEPDSEELAGIRGAELLEALVELLAVASELAVGTVGTTPVYEAVVMSFVLVAVTVTLLGTRQDPEVMVVAVALAEPLHAVIVEQVLVVVVIAVPVAAPFKPVE